MQLSNVLLLALASVAFASPGPEPAENSKLTQCGWPNGNCYENGCRGELSADRTTCTAGPYRGCQCGYGCGRNTGKCNENGCNGQNGRCTGNYFGCSCLG